MNCGCQSGINKRGQEWIRFCATHQAEQDAVRARWHADYRQMREQQDLACVAPSFAAAAESRA